MSLESVAIAVPAVLALVAIVVSLAALRAAQVQHRLQLENAAHLENAAALGELWLLIGQHPGLLRFHGLSDADLDAVGLKPVELAYLVASFEAASHFYESLDDDTGIFPKASLRYGMCAAEPTRKAWPMIKPFLAATPRYVRRIEKTMAHHARRSPGGAGAVTERA